MILFNSVRIYFGVNQQSNIIFMILHVIIKTATIDNYQLTMIVFIIFHII